ncbi:MAG: GNAT family N-acetyltransferase [Myxococcales bacterium FL481]|nr:MAG: GNAT family N-acetyltransferase [Myxococcales bacterium FL481]
MQIRKLGTRSDLIFPRFCGRIDDRGDYLAIRTPSNPNYYWGNYLVFDHPPVRGCLSRWVNIFHHEFPDYAHPHHYAFAWDDDGRCEPDCTEFLQANFREEREVVLVIDRIEALNHIVRDLEIAECRTAADWDAAWKLLLRTAGPMLTPYHREYCRVCLQHYRRMSEAGKGAWLLARCGGEMVAHVGIYCDGELGRFRQVATLPSHRRRGIASLLVAEAAKLGTERFGASKLVIVADPDSSGERLYKRLGFREQERNDQLSWSPADGALGI